MKVAREKAFLEPVKKEKRKKAAENLKYKSVHQIVELNCLDLLEFTPVEVNGVRIIWKTCGRAC